MSRLLRAQPFGDVEPPKPCGYVGCSELGNQVLLLERSSSTGPLQYVCHVCSQHEDTLPTARSLKAKVLERLADHGLRIGS